MHYWACLSHKPDIAALRRYLVTFSDTLCIEVLNFISLVGCSFQLKMSMSSGFEMLVSRIFKLLESVLGGIMEFEGYPSKF